MAVVKELLRVEENQTLSFGDYTLAKKTKVEDFEFQGDLYKVKTFVGITKLERNGLFVYESVPGSAVEEFYMDDNGASFKVSSGQDIQLTVELEPEQIYCVAIGENEASEIKTNLGGKLNMSLEMGANRQEQVKITKA